MISGRVLLVSLDVKEEGGLSLCRVAVHLRGSL